MIPEPIPADLARDAEADWDIVSPDSTREISSGDFELFALNALPAWIRRAVAAEAERDELRKRVAELETRLYDLWEGENQAEWDDYEKRHGL